MANIVGAPGSRFAPTRPPEQTGTHCSSNSTGDEQHGCDACDRRSKSHRSESPYLAGRCPSSKDPMAASTCGQAAVRGLAISKWPAFGMVIILTESPARIAAAA
jgi:hypothetical protein